MSSNKTTKTTKKSTKSKISKAIKKDYVFSRTRIAIFVVLTIILLCTLPFSTQIERSLNIGTGTLEYPNDITNMSGLKVHYIDVGQGDATVIEFPDGKEMLIDAGPTSSSDELIAYINEYVFTEGEVCNFEYILLTHSDADHCGGMVAIFESYTVSNVYRPKIFSDIESETMPEGSRVATTIVYRNFITAITEAQTTNGTNILFAMEGERIPFETEPYTDYEIIFYSPDESYYSDVNNFSPIIILSYKGRDFMFVGDADAGAEEEFLDDNSDYDKVDVLKVGHHGSSTSTSVELLDVITPDYAVISVGEGNTYDHPDIETINKLLTVGVFEANIFRTDTQSNILAYVSTSGRIQFYTFKTGPIYEYIVWWQIIIVLIGAAAAILFKKESKSK